MRLIPLKWHLNLKLSSRQASRNHCTINTQRDFSEYSIVPIHLKCSYLAVLLTMDDQTVVRLRDVSFGSYLNI